MNVVILFVVLVICLTLADRDPSNYVEGVKDIKPENFYDTLRLSPTFLLVEFYNPRCPWCRKFVDELEVLSTLLSRHSRVIRLAKMDITLPASHHIKMDQKIRGTPSVALYTRGKTTPLLMQGSPLWRNYWRIDAETRLERILKFVNENCQLTLLISDLDEEEDEVEDGSAHPLAIDMAANPEHMTAEQLAARKQSLIAKLTGKGRVQFGPDVMTAEEEEEIRQRQQKEIGTEGWSLHDLGEFTGRAQSILKKPFAEPKLPTTQQQQEETKQRKKKSRREKFQERDQQIQEAWIAAERAAEGVVVFNSEVGIGGDALGTNIDAVLAAQSKELGEEGNTQQPNSESEGVINEELWDGIETVLSELEPPVDATNTNMQDDEKPKESTEDEQQQEGSVAAPVEDGQPPQQHANSTHDTVGEEGGSIKREGAEEDHTVPTTQPESLESTPMDQAEQKGQDDVQLERGAEEEQIPTNPENNKSQQPSEDLPEAKEDQPEGETADQGPEL